MESRIKKQRFDGSEVEVLGETYEEGMTQQGDKYDWQSRLGEDKDELLKFLKTGLRYWYGEGYGSEKRKNPA